MPPIEAAPTAPSVRESIEGAISTVVPDTAPVQDAPAAEPTLAEASNEPPAQETAEEKAGRTAGRARDEKGRLLPGKAEKAAEVQAAPAVPAAPKAPRPTSWKKELEAQWETLPAEIQAYIREREGQYATGVSTYKTEADRAKGVMGALAEFEPSLQQAGIPVDKWIQSMGHAHRTLAMGAPQDKIAMVQNILANNRIPAQLAVQDAQGQWQLLGVPAPQQQPAQPQFNPQELDARIQRTVEERLANQKATASYEAFQAEVKAGKYPHLEEVKPTMGRLLETGFAKDYTSAYDTALRMPEHVHLAPVAQQQQPADKEAERFEAEKQKVARARSQAVSVRSSTPSAMAQSSGPQGLREQLSDAYDRAAGGSRV